MSNDNEAYFAWRQSLQPMESTLRRANTDALNAFGAVDGELRAGRPREARTHLADLRAAIERRQRALDAWIAAIDVDVPNRRP